MPTTDNNQLVLNSLRIDRGGRTLIDGLSLDISAGDLVILKGANGCGKSSLMRALAGFLPLAKGSITWITQDVTDDREILLADMTYLGHQNGLKATFTLAENLKTIAQITDGQQVSNDKIQTAASQLNMETILHEPVKYYSSGQLRRAGLTRFPLLSKKIWLMDEPTVGLDAENRARLSTMMQDHLSQGGIIIAATHEDLGITGKIIDLTEYKPQGNDTFCVDSALEGWV